MNVGRSASSEEHKCADVFSDHNSEKITARGEVSQGQHLRLRTYTHKGKLVEIKINKGKYFKTHMQM